MLIPRPWRRRRCRKREHHWGARPFPGAAAAALGAPDPLMATDVSHVEAVPVVTKPRLMLSIALSPQGQGIRSRPLVLLGAAATTHVRRWRSAEALLTSAGCEAYGGSCLECLGASFAEGPHAAPAAPPQFGCAWCSSSLRCVPDVTAACVSSAEHIGQSGLGGSTCPGDHLLHPEL